MIDISAKIKAGEYKSKLEYPDRIDPDYREKLGKRRIDRVRLDEQLRLDLESNYVCPHEVTRNNLWKLAWDNGHSSGHQEVVMWYEELFEDLVLPLLKECT